jgi:hypothetical protein
MPQQQATEQQGSEPAGTYSPAAQSASAWYGSDPAAASSAQDAVLRNVPPLADAVSNPRAPLASVDESHLQVADEEDDGVPARVLAAQAAERRRRQALSAARSLQTDMDDDEAAVALRRARQITGEYVPSS